MLMTILFVLFGTFLGLPTPKWWDDIVGYFTKIINVNFQILKTIYQVFLVLQKIAEAYQQFQNQTAANNTSIV